MTRAVGRSRGRSHPAEGRGAVEKPSHSRTITSGGWDGLTWQYGEQIPSLPFEFGSAASRSQPLQPEQDLAAGDGTGDHAIICSNR